MNLEEFREAAGDVVQSLERELGSVVETFEERTGLSVDRAEVQREPEGGAVVRVLLAHPFDGGRPEDRPRPGVAV